MPSQNADHERATDASDARGLSTAVARLDPLFLALPLALIASLLYGPNFRPNPDAYWHVQCGALYLEQGWVTAFPWLPFTVLADFPNPYILQHMLIAPLHLIFGRESVIQASAFVFNAAFVLSAYAVLRAWRVAYAGAWTAVLCAGAPMVGLYFGVFKGGVLFFALFVWFLHFLFRESVRGVFVVGGHFRCQPPHFPPAQGLFDAVNVLVLPQPFLLVLRVGIPRYP